MLGIKSTFTIITLLTLPAGRSETTPITLMTLSAFKSLIARSILCVNRQGTSQYMHT